MTGRDQVLLAIAGMQAAHDSYQAALKMAKSEFKRYITDKSLPLGERWMFFCNAPAFMKEKGDWVPDRKYKALTKFLEALDNMKGEHVDLEFQLSEGINADTGEVDPQHFEDMSYSDVLTIKDIQAAMEETLALNLSSFYNDW